MKEPDGKQHNAGVFTLHITPRRRIYVLLSWDGGVEWGNRPYPLRLPETCLPRNLRTEVRSHSTNPVVISFGIFLVSLFFSKEMVGKARLGFGEMTGCLGIGVEDRTGVGGKLKGMLPSFTFFPRIQG
jgi:hypothetical protein